MDRLPTEIVLKILGYLNTHDLMQFCNAYDNYSCFFKEKSIVRLIDFSRRFELQNFPLCKFITTALNYVHIKILNVNYLYWIPSKDLRGLMKKLVNLEVLYAIDTKLGIIDKDIEEYVKLRKLAVSIESNQFVHSTIISSKKLKALKSLCIKINQKKDDCSGMYLFFREIKHLEELWISDDDDESICRINYGQIVILLSNLKIFVIKSKTLLPYYDFGCAGLTKIFECKRSNTATELIFEKIVSKPEVSKMSIFEPLENESERLWKIFGSLHKDLPCGPVESKAIYLNNCSIKDVYFEDLNFCHTVILCNVKYINAALQILASKNSAKLKKLSFRSCLLQNSEAKPKDEQMGFKRIRRGVQTSCRNHPFESTARNLNNLRELEILICPRCSDGAVISAYPLIGILENLLKLTLEIPLLLDGSFLKEVFTQCKHLESLSITCMAQNEKFVINLCQNLRYSTNLRDFRLEHKEITIDKLLNSFNELSYKKLLRFFFKCDNLRYASVYNETEPFATFMKNNPQVIFFFAVITNNTVKQNSDIQKTLNNFRQGNPARVFYVKKDVSTVNGVFPIPAAHHDMIFNCTNVSVINLDEF